MKSDIILEFLILSILICLILLINRNARKYILKWASEKDYRIEKCQYLPLYWTFKPMVGGYHPANFRIVAKDSKNIIKIFQIQYGGFFFIKETVLVCA